MKKERHPIDEFFREELNEYRISPTEEARQAFLKDAESLPKRSPYGWWWFSALLLVIVLVSGGAFLYSGRNEETIRISNDFSSTIQDTHNNKNVSQSTESKKREKSGTHYLSESLQPDVTQHPRDEVRQQTRNYGIRNDSPVPTESKPVIIEEQAVEDDVFLSEPGPFYTEVKTKDSAMRQVKFTAIPDTSQATVPTPPKSSGKHTWNSEWRLGAGLYLSPEWMFGTIEEPTFVNNFGFEGMFRFGRYSLRTGAGVSISKGTNQLMVEYNDYLGSYMELDSMSFAWDEQHYYLVPTYYLTNKDVYDSLMKLDDSKIVKRYTYLQIPIVFGYDFIAKEKISFGLRAGPIMSILLNEKTLSDPYDPGKKKIISINEITPEQVNLNWQIMVGLNATFRLSKRIGIEVEPFAKYYFNSVHETTSGSGKPWSVGLRAAFFISFEK